MGVKNGKWVWKDGKFVEWENANIHVMSHVVHYASSVFEGLRAYDTHLGPAVFRLYDHMDRLKKSGRMYRMEPQYTTEELCDAVLDTIRKNNMGACYVRPFAFRGFGAFGVNPLNNPLETYICIWEWGKYLGDDALENGVDVRVSSWRRFAPDTFPSLAKSGANYMNSQLIKMEALMDGYAEGIALDTSGYISEGSGENIFLIRKGVLFTPSLSASILPGLTRNTVIQICHDLGYEVREVMIPRETLYVADEVFFTGTAAEITPIRSVDKIEVGDGKRGPITKKIQEEFFNIFNGKRKIPEDWLTKI
jgi:branched-chain amino acid aminotransferase